MWLTDAKDILAYSKYYGHLPCIPENLDPFQSSTTCASNSPSEVNGSESIAQWKYMKSAHSQELHDDQHVDWHTAKSKAYAYGFRYGRAAKHHLDYLEQCAEEKMINVQGPSDCSVTVHDEESLGINVGTDVNRFLTEPTESLDDLYRNSARSKYIDILALPRTRPVLLDQFCGLLKRNDKWAKSEAEEEAENTSKGQDLLDLRKQLLQIMDKDKTTVPALHGAVVSYK